MRRFHFRLEPLLEMRRQREDERKMELAAKRAETRRRQNETRAAEAEIRAVRETRRRLTAEGGAADCAALGDCDRYEAVQTIRLRRAEAAVREALAAEEGARRAYEAALKERKILEKLKERHAARHWAEEQRRDQALLDDIGAIGVEHRARQARQMRRAAQAPAAAGDNER